MKLVRNTIPALVETAAQSYGSDLAIEDGSVTLTFDELNAACRRAARAFIALGIVHGDRVAVWAPNFHEWIVAAIGAQSVGAVLVPLNTRFKGAEAGYILKKSAAKVLVTIEEL